MRYRSRPYALYGVHTSDMLHCQSGMAEDEEAFVHSFHLDICQSPELKKALLALSQAAQPVLVEVHQYADSWKRHQSLWKSDKAAALDRFKVYSKLCSIQSPLPKAGGTLYRC